MATACPGGSTAESELDWWQAGLGQSRVQGSCAQVLSEDVKCVMYFFVDLRMIELNKNYVKISEWMGAIA